MTIEKRKYLRFLAKDDEYAFLGNQFNKAERLKDISIAGLAFTYFENTEDSVQDFSKASIIVFDSKIYLQNLACRIIYDSALDETDKNQYLKSALRERRCGIQFTAITKYQLKILEFFINHRARQLMIS